MHELAQELTELPDVREKGRELKHEIYNMRNRKVLKRENGMGKIAALDLFKLIINGNQRVPHL